jgi:hypothetical protein
MIGTFEDYGLAIELAKWYASMKWCSGANVVTESDGSYSVIWYDKEGSVWYA